MSGNLVFKYKGKSAEDSITPNQKVEEEKKSEQDIANKISESSDLEDCDDANVADEQASEGLKNTIKDYTVKL